MPAYFETGFFLNEGAWHGLGTILDHPPTAIEAMVAANLDWRVELGPLYRFVPEDGGGLYHQDVEGAMHPVEDNFAVVRDSDQRCLGVVGSRFRPLQNEDAFGFFDFLVENGDFNYESAGSLHDGKKVWVLASLANGVAEVVKDDPIHAFVLLSHAHDGSQSVEIYNTDVRVVCANTEAMARASGELMGGVRHTKNVRDRISALKDAVAQRHVVFATAMERYRFLAGKKLPGGEIGMRLFVRALFGQEDGPEKERMKDPLPRGGAEIVRLFAEGRGNDLPGVAGTHWAAFNAVTENIDHVRGIGGKGDTLSKRVSSAWFGQGNAVKERALALLSKSAMVA